MSSEQVPARRLCHGAYENNQGELTRQLMRISPSGEMPFKCEVNNSGSKKKENEQKFKTFAETFLISVLNY